MTMHDDRPLGRSRPTYESQSDREAERKVIKAACDRWKMSAHAAPKFCRYDYTFSLDQPGQVDAIAEVKVRSHPAEAFPTFFISASKWIDLCSASRALGIPFVILIGFNSGKDIRYYRHDLDREDRLAVKWGGRSDRDDPADQEMMIHIPIPELKPL